MTFHHLGTTFLGASVFAFLSHWSSVFQAIAALCAIGAYAIAAYNSIKKK